MVGCACACGRLRHNNPKQVLPSLSPSLPSPFPCLTCSRPRPARQTNIESVSPYTTRAGCQGASLSD